MYLTNTLFNDMKITQNVGFILLNICDYQSLDSLICNVSTG